MVLLRHISIALTAAVAAFGSALFIALNYLYRRRIWSPEAEYYMIKELEGVRICVCTGQSTWGRRMPWCTWLTPLIEDVSHRPRLRYIASSDCTHNFLWWSWGTNRTSQNALSVSELHEALSLGAVADERRLFLLAAQLGSDGLIVSRNLQAFQDLLLQLV
eukprot:XP_013993454.1 PREDICTED: uncharacterized protein LOC106568004 isoform X3 [Salmo salar]